MRYQALVALLLATATSAGAQPRGAAGISANDRTLWYQASTSKSFIGVAISLLADRGVLRLDAPIKWLLPGVAWNPEVHADSLTLANFLSHTHHINDNAVVMSAVRTGRDFRRSEISAAHRARRLR